MTVITDDLRARIEEPAMPTIPAYTLAVGAPARVVDYFGPPGQDPRDAGPGEGADALGDQPAERAG